MELAEASFAEVARAGLTLEESQYAQFGGIIAAGGQFVESRLVSPCGSPS